MPSFEPMPSFQDPLFILFGLAIATIILAFFVLWITSPGNQKYSQKLKLDARKAQNANPDKNLPQYKDLFADFFAHIENERGQNKNIFVLTVITILAGFAIIAYGGWLYMKFEPDSYVGKSLQEIVAQILIQPLLVIFAGVFTEFIAVLILLIYRSVSRQSEFHFKSIERLTTVGTAIQILDDLADDKGVKEELKSTAKADLAKKLLDIYLDSAVQTDRVIEKKT